MQGSSSLMTSHTVAMIVQSGINNVFAELNGFCTRLAGRIYRRGIEPKSIECSTLIAYARLPWDLVPANFMAQSFCETDGRSTGLSHMNLLYFICNAHWLTVQAHVIWNVHLKNIFSHGG